VAYEWTGALATPARSQSAGVAAMPAGNMPAAEVEVKVRKPPPRSASGHTGH